MFSSMHSYGVGVNINRVNFGLGYGFGDDYAKAADARKHVNHRLAALNKASDALCAHMKAWVKNSIFQRQP